MVNGYLTVDGFCGGGGWSTGFEQAIGTPVDIGINHDADAIALHKANHPKTKHYNENIWIVDPYEACSDRPVGWAHFSPDCKHFSRAKGAKPVSKNIRGLAWVVVKWAGMVKPNIISMENVIEFTTWGPLIAVRGPSGRVKKKDGTEAAKGEYVPFHEQQLIPDKKRAGQTFKKFIKILRSMGYHIEWRELVACDYGAPTSRKRFFLIARRDGKPIVWPEPTHGDPNSLAVKNGLLKPWVPASDIIDWSLECPSIFDRKKPLADNTLKRIARGIQKYVIDNPAPFIVQVNHSGESFRGQSISEPLPTLTAKHGFGVVAPHLIQYHTEQSENEHRGQGLQEPLKTVDTANRYGLSVATLIQTGYGEREGQAPRVPGLDKPLGTIVSTAKHAAVQAFLTEYMSQDVEQESAPQADAETLTTSNLLQFNNHCDGLSVNDPLPTITAQSNHFAEVRALLVKYYGDGTGQPVTRPLDTITTKDRFGLVTIKGTQYQIIDIGLRMLTPRELYNAQGFPKDYEIETDCNGKRYPKSKQVARCGNAVPPPFATALVRANWPEACVAEPIETMEKLYQKWSA